MIKTTYFWVIWFFFFFPAKSPKKSRSFADDVMKLFRSEFVEKVKNTKKSSLTD